jgi:nitrate/nitrite transporter NarK
LSIPICLLSLSHSILTAFTLAEISRIISWHQAGIAFGFIEILDAIAGFVINLFFGWISETTKSYSFGLYVIFLSSLVGNIFLLYFTFYPPGTDYMSL